MLWCSKKLVHLAMVLLMVAGPLACGGGSSSDKPAVNEEVPEQTQSNSVDCELTVRSLMENLEDSAPSWEQIDCYTNELTRISNPTFYLQASDKPPEEYDPNSGDAAPPTAWELLVTDLAYFEQWPSANIFGYNLSDVPPYLLSESVGYTTEQWDEKLRGMATMGIYIKQQGQRLKVDFFYPPSLGDRENDVFPIVNSAGEWLAWWEGNYIPARVSIAEVAERIKAEYYQPWDVEPGIFLRGMGEGWLELMSETEQIALAQEAIDSLYDALRPVFSGTLVIINYDRYAAFGEYWKNVDLSGWDQVNFVLFTEGDVVATQNYLAEQLEVYQEMVIRDGIDNWVLQGVTVDPESHKEFLPDDVSFEDIELDIYLTIISSILGLHIPLNGLGITTGHIQTSGAEDLVKDFYASLIEK